MGARLIRVRGVVQGVGFRPFVYRLARANALGGWVLNQENGVEIHVEGCDAGLQAFLRRSDRGASSARQISARLKSWMPKPSGLAEFSIRDSQRAGPPSVRISPDLPVCDACLAELFDPADRRYLYPYINCTNCGPRFTVIESLPYDRPRTTMRHGHLIRSAQISMTIRLIGGFTLNRLPAPIAALTTRLNVPSATIHRRRAERKGRGRIAQCGTHRRDQRDRRISPELRRRESRGGPGACVNASFAKRSRSRVMVRSIEIARRLVELSPAAENCCGHRPGPLFWRPRR